jgi:hypothetical protein
MGLCLAFAMGCHGTPSAEITGGTPTRAPLGESQEVGATAAPSPLAGPSPVVVELYSSEGCSSCPSAETVLRDLEGDPSIVPLELHVDYWNGLGWADPYSKAAYSARQRMYSSRIHQDGIYTPEAIVNGATGVVGSDRRKLLSLVRDARAVPSKTRLTMVREGEGLVLKVTETKGAAKGEIRLFTAESGLVTRVLHGENEGKTLAHGPVVREIEGLGPSRDGLTIRIAKPKQNHVHYAATVADSRSWAILGAAVAE